MRIQGAPGIWVHPQHAEGHFHDVARRREDFPKVRFWTKHQWTQYKKSLPTDFARVNLRGGTRAANGVNVRYGFMQNPVGESVSGYRATEARARFREYTVYLHHRGRAPDTWSRGLDLEDRIGYERWMRAMCPELQYCDGNWMCAEIAVKEYPQWKPAYERRLARRRLEAAKRAEALLAGGTVDTGDLPHKIGMSWYSPVTVC